MVDIQDVFEDIKALSKGAIGGCFLERSSDNESRFDCNGTDKSLRRHGRGLGQGHHSGNPGSCIRWGHTAWFPTERPKVITKGGSRDCSRPMQRSFSVPQPRSQRTRQ